MPRDPLSSMISLETREGESSRIEGGSWRTGFGEGDGGTSFCGSDTEKGKSNFSDSSRLTSD